MKEKKSLKRILPTILLLLAIIVIIAMAYYIYSITNNSENADNNTVSSSNNTSNQNRSVIYEFTSADKAAAEGHPKILKIFELTENKLDFEYDSAYDFNKNTLDRQVSGTAKTNADEIYEFEETVDNHQYKLIFEFNKSKDTVKVYEYDNGNEIGFINLYR